jgi:hypothetical protein
MSAYYNRSGGCFDGDALVAMAGGQMLPVHRVRVGDRLASGARVRCVVRTTVPDGELAMVRVGGVFLTPYHPVRLGGEWVFPVQLRAAERVCVSAIYDFVLDSEHAAVIGGTECVTMGHGTP